MSSDILEILIPTSKTRIDNLMCQIHTSLNSGVPTRITIAMAGEYPELMDRLSKSELENIRIVKNVPQGNASIPISYCLENVEWNDWIYIPADDDSILPWGLKSLWDARANVSMVIGQVLCVSRHKHYDFSVYKVGREIAPGHVSGACAMFNMRSIEKLEKPWFIIDPLSDFHLIKRMSDSFKYKIIPTVIGILSLCELEDLGLPFKSHFMSLYGALV